MSYPSQLNRWVRASLVKHFYNALKDIEHVHVEGQERRTKDKQKWFELRIDGPFIREVTKSRFRINTEVNILVVNLQDNSNPSIYGMDELTGQAASKFVSCVEIFRYGDVADDAANDGSRIGELQLRPQNDEEIDVTFFGKLRPDTPVEQASVESHYQGFWTF
jgi:hypothetical protein